MININRLLILCALGLSIAPIANAADNPVIISYWSNWNEYKNPPYPVPGSNIGGVVQQNKDLQDKINQIDVLNYDFLETHNDGVVYFTDSWGDLAPSDMSFCNTDNLHKEICTDVHGATTPGDGNFSAFTKLKNTSNNLRLSISVGGWGHEDSFNQAFAYPDKFIDSLYAIVTAYKLTGVDLDYEVEAPTFDPTKATQFANLVQQLRAKLGPNYLITFAAPASPAKIDSIGLNNWKTISDNVNYIDIMAYDLHGEFDSPHLTNYASNLYLDPKDPFPSG